MTRQDELYMKKERNRREYLAAIEEKRAKSRQWYWDHREHVKQQHKDLAARHRKTDKVTKTPPPSTESLESQLPYALRKDIAYIRRDFLKINISERPPYDQYLRQKTIEYLNRNTE